ncbi:hypothetical protein ABZS77_09290 [Micromonospora sp. NPDC005298]|uniref:hypothetical protein n=1 Tax=Micromonospora sp. NPDC005298 TaxID=3156873 RepID=UPI0033B70CA2
MAEPSRPRPYQPGAVSLFFVATTGVFAAGFWSWLLVLVLRSYAATGVEVLAATGAVTASLVGVVLGVRLALQRNASVRHAEMKRLLVDISWNAFVAVGNAEGVGKVVPFPTGTGNKDWISQRSGSERLSTRDRLGRDRGGDRLR